MHYHKIKMTAAAMAMAVLVTGNMPAAELNTATVSAKSAISAVLPAAGVGLVLNDGVSVSQIREEIKKRKEEKVGHIAKHLAFSRLDPGGSNVAYQHSPAELSEGRNLSREG